MDHMDFQEKLDAFPIDIWQELKTTQKPIILFGAGNKGLKVLKVMREKGLEPKVYCDNNQELQGKKYYGKDVISYDTLRASYSNYILLITTTTHYAKEIYRQIKRQGEKNPIHHLTIPFKVDETFLLKTSIVENIKEYKKVYDYLEDEKSKTIYMMFLAYKVTGNAMHLSSQENGDTFFDEVLINSEKKHHYVDVGAFTGDTIMKFCQFCKGNYQKIDAFELDKGNFSKLELFIKYARLQNVRTHNIGAWHSKALMPYYTLEGTFKEGFENPNLYYDVHEKLDYDFIEEIKQKKVKAKKIISKVNSLDNVLSGSVPSIIKVNALASDHSVIQGCQKIAKSYKPAFIIDFGAKASHIIKIPLTLKQFDSTYKLYLRQKTIFNDSKTVLYAI